MNLTSKLLEQIAINTRPKIEEHMLIVMDRSIHREHLYEPLQTSIKQFKIAVTFLTGYNGIFNITSNNNKFYFSKSIIDDNHFKQITIPEGAYEIENLNKEIKRIIVDEGHFFLQECPFLIKPNSSTLGSIIEISNEESAISFNPDDSIRDLLGFNKTSIYEKHNLSTNAVDKISFDNIFFESNIAQGVIFRGKRSGVIHNFTMTVNPGYKYVERFEGGISWFVTKNIHVISSINFRIKNENEISVSFNGQSITFRLSINGVLFI